MISQVQQNSGMRSSVMPGARMFMMVTITLIAPMIEDAPIRWTANIAIGKLSPVWITSGGYSVQPPAGEPPGASIVPSSRMNANGSSQKLKLFMRGSAMSGAPTCSGIIQLAMPTHAGITPPKIMTSACAVVIELKNCGSTNCRPGWNSSARITSAIAPPDEEHDAGEHQVHRADVLVVGRHHPAADEAFRRAVVVVVVITACPA